MIRIRPAIVADAAAIWRAEMETAEIPGRLASRPHELQLAAFEKRIRDLEAIGCYVVATEDERVCGHAFLEPMPLEAVQHVYRLTIVVHPGYNGRGIGTQLLRRLQHWAHDRDGLHKIELHVRATNESAIRLYQRLGFTEEGRHRDRVKLPDGSFVDDIAMAWFPSRGPV
jgi:RimJ/RimL family protein N-acetyltransferase